jgi:hypothetical protein
MPSVLSTEQSDTVAFYYTVGIGGVSRLCRFNNDE